MAYRFKPLNRSRLRAILDEEGINPDTYSFDGGHPAERYVIGSQPDGWAFYYSERGNENDRKDFQTEDEACRYLLDRLRRDPTTHFHLVVGPLPSAEADAAFADWRREHGLDGDRLEPSDFKADNPVMADGKVRRYWVLGTKLR